MTSIPTPTRMLPMTTTMGTAPTITTIILATMTSLTLSITQPHPNLNPTPTPTPTPTAAGGAVSDEVGRAFCRKVGVALRV